MKLKQSVNYGLCACGWLSSTRGKQPHLQGNDSTGTEKWIYPIAHLYTAQHSEFQDGRIRTLQLEKKSLSHVSEMLNKLQWRFYLIFFIFPVGENYLLPRYYLPNGDFIYNAGNVMFNS